MARSPGIFRVRPADMDNIFRMGREKYRRYKYLSLAKDGSNKHYMN